MIIFVEIIILVTFEKHVDPPCFAAVRSGFRRKRRILIFTAVKRHFDPRRISPDETSNGTRKKNFISGCGTDGISSPFSP